MLLTFIWWSWALTKSDLATWSQLSTLNDPIYCNKTQQLQINKNLLLRNERVKWNLITILFQCMLVIGKKRNLYILEFYYEIL